MVYPVKAFYQHVHLRPHVLGPLFVFPHGQPVMRHDLAGMVNKLCGFLNLPSIVIKFHSLRIGSTIHLYLCGVSTDKIKEKGHCSLDCCKADALWFIGDHVLQKACVDMCANTAHAHLRSAFQFIEMTLSKNVDGTSSFCLIGPYSNASFHPQSNGMPCRAI